MRPTLAYEYGVHEGEQRCDAQLPKCTLMRTPQTLHHANAGCKLCMPHPSSEHQHTH